MYKNICARTSLIYRNIFVLLPYFLTSFVENLLGKFVYASHSFPGYLSVCLSVHMAVFRYFWYFVLLILVFFFCIFPIFNYALVESLLRSAFVGFRSKFFDKERSLIMWQAGCPTLPTWLSLPPLPSLTLYLSLFVALSKL